MKPLTYRLRDIVWTAYLSVALLLAAIAVVLFTPLLALAGVLALGSISFSVLAIRA